MGIAASPAVLARGRFRGGCFRAPATRSGRRADADCDRRRGKWPRNASGASAWVLRTRRRNSRFSSYWDMLPPTSCPSACHSFQYFQPGQSMYRPESDGTRYALREKVRFFEPFRYGASCVEVHEET